MNRSDFTILMAVYKGDCALLLERALSSVFSNNLLPNAMVLVVDGPVSTEIQQVIDRYSVKPGVLVLALPVNKGLAFALNAGLALVETEWVVRADADDLNRPTRFETLHDAMEDSVDLIGSSIHEIERDGQLIAERRLPLNHDEIAKFMLRRNPFNHMSVAFRSSLARQCGGYPYLHLREDYGLWIRMHARGARMRNLPQVLVDATTGRDMYARRGGWATQKRNGAFRECWYK
jgi:glycosyltransferase involved in cell wall biosynthesis